MGLATANTIRCLQGLNPGDKVAAAGGFLIDAETRLNPAAASTYFGASGSPQAGVRSSAPSSTSMRESNPAAPIRRIKRPQAVVAADNATDHASHGARRGFMPEELKKPRATSGGGPATGIEATLVSNNRRGIRLDGNTRQNNLARAAGPLMLQRMCWQSKAKSGRDAQKHKGIRSINRRQCILNTRTTSSME